MLSTERSIDPSSSSLNQIEVKSDERNSAQRIGSQKLDTLDIVVPPATPNFSIRDHVYKSRSNRIDASWPFKPKFLQLCIKNGVKELLPPFEPPHLIKSRTNSVTAQSDPIITHVLRGRRELNSEDNIDQVTENLRSNVIKHKKNRNKGFRKVKSSSELPEKKCKLVVKLSCSVPGTSQVEELASNNSAAVDQMASKICPVCKIFSSSSNTTLNAHIDQCLSMGSSTKQFELDALKPRIKPRKKKLMVEIYATALHYTLEDLDRRNGTNWAASAAAADPSESRTEPVNTNTKEPVNRSEVMVKSRGKDREGSVYVDSNGIKIRILSNDGTAQSSVVSREDMKKGKVPFEKRKGVGMKNMEKNKLKLNKKKFKKFKILKTQVQQLTADGDRSGIGTENENRGANPHLNQLLETSKDPVILNGTASPLGNWVCAKRTDIHKKRKNKNPFKITQSLASITEDCPSTSSQVSKNSNSKFTNSKLQLKLPKPLLGNGENSGEALPVNASTNTSFCTSPSAEPKNSSALSRNFRKQRSMLKSGKRGGQIPSSSRVFYKSTDVLAGETIRENKRFKFTQNDRLHEEFAPEPEQFTENTKVQDATSPTEDTELDVEATASKGHLNKYVDATSDEPIHLQSASWLQEEFAVARRASDCDDENNDVLEAEDDNEGHGDDNVSAAAADDDDDYDDADEVAFETSDETGHNTPQDDSSITSNGEDEMNLERSLANFRELSGSPSTASTMSLSALNEPFTKQHGSFTQPLRPDLMVQVAERPQGVEEIMDKPCVCSCKEILPKDCKKAPTVMKERQLPPLYIGPRETGPFNAYRSFPRPGPMVNSGYESPSQSFSTLSQSPVPPSPNPVLRLMGKNLLVVNHEEITVQPPTPNSHSPGFGSPNCGVNQNFSYQNFSSVVSQSQPAANMYQPFLVSDRQRVVSPPYVPNEVIVIDDPPKIDNMLLPVPVPMQLQGVSMVGGNPAPQSISILGATMMQHSPFFCFPQHQAGPSGPFLYPRVGTGYITQQVPSSSHELESFVPSSFAFRSPSSHVGNPLFYSHTMR